MKEIKDEPIIIKDNIASKENSVGPQQDNTVTNNKGQSSVIKTPLEKDGLFTYLSPKENKKVYFENIAAPKASASSGDDKLPIKKEDHAKALPS